MTATDNDARILTVTWSADLEHFALLRDSLAVSRLATLPHDVIVQTEDLPLFERFRGDGVALYPTSDFLPAEVERRRVAARRRQDALGRRATVLLGSLSRRTGWPAWVRYTGWHTQQLCKLAAAARAGTAVILDADVVVTRHADPADFAAPGRHVCFAQWHDVSALEGKVRRWQETTHRLFDAPLPDAGRVDCQFDTPFVMHGRVVTALAQWLEARYGRPWWQVLLSLPPRGWSEFCIYKTYLRLLSNEAVDWRDTGMFGYLFDASDPARLVEDFGKLAGDGRRHYVTIHSQSAGQRRWDPRSYADGVRSRLNADRGSVGAASRRE